MTPEELDEARAKEAVRIWSSLRLARPSRLYDLLKGVRHAQRSSPQLPPRSRPCAGD